MINIKYHLKCIWSGLWRTMIAIIVGCALAAAGVDFIKLFIYFQNYLFILVGFSILVVIICLVDIFMK